MIKVRIDQYQRKCIVQNHEQSVIVKFCSHSNCKVSRYICDKCIQEKIHQHELQNDGHIIHPVIFKSQLDEKVDDLTNVCDFYYWLQNKFQEIQDTQAQKQKFILCDFENERKILTSLLKRVDVRKSSIMTITEEEIVYGTQILNGDTYKHHMMKIKSVRKYYEMVLYAINSIMIKNGIPSLKVDIIKQSTFEKMIISDYKTHILISKLSREEIYLILLDTSSQIVFFNLQNHQIYSQNCGVIKSVVDLILIESQDHLFVGTSVGEIYTFNFRFCQELQQISVWQVTKEQIVQMIDQNRNNNNNDIILFCKNGDIMVVNPIYKQIIRLFTIEYQELSKLGYQQCRESKHIRFVMPRVANSQTSLKQKKVIYNVAFAVKEKYLALYSTSDFQIEVYEFYKFPIVELNLLKKLQQSKCIYIQWILEDNFMAIQLLEKTIIIDSQNFEVVKTIETKSIQYIYHHSISSNQCFESKKLSCFIDIEKKNIVIYKS